MATKIPGKLRRPIKAPLFEKRYLTRIYLDPDRAFVDASFETTEAGERKLRDDLTPKDRERLARVLKEARRNRGLLRIGRLAVPLVVVGAITLFNLLFLDSILENAGERLLESLFQAQAEIEELDARPLEAAIVIDRIVVADAAAPMTNLFELGPVRFEVNLRGLVAGRLVVENASSQGLVFGTPRESSGALLREQSDGGGALGEAHGAVTQRLQAGGEAALASMGLAGGGLESLAVDPGAFVAERVGTLSAPAIADELIAEFEAERVAWQTRVELLSARADEVQETVTRVRSIDPASLTTIPAITDAVTVAQTASTTVSSLADDARSLQAGIDASVAQIAAAPQRVETAVRNDYEALVSQIPDLSIDPRALASSAVAPFMAAALGDSYQTVMRVVSVLERVTAVSGDGSPGAAAGPRRRGRLVTFGAQALPRFAVLQAQASGSTQGAELAVTLRDLSSQPQLLGRPMGFSFDRTSPEEMLAVGGTAELAAGAEPFLTISAAYTGALALEESALAAAGIAGARGGLSLEFESTLARSERLAGSTAIALAEPELAPAPAAPPVATLVAEVVNGESVLTADAQWALSAAGIEELTVQSSLGDALARRVGELIDEIRRDIEARIRTELDELLAESLTRLSTQTDALAALEGRSLDELAQAETWQTLVAEQRAELEGRVAALRGEAEAAVRAEAERAARQAQAEAEAAAQAAAEEAARRAAEEAANRGIQLPGFGGR